MVEGRVVPRRRAMALLAGLREATRYVVRIGRALKILQVAAHASRVRTGQVVVIVHVALRTLHRRVRPGQREARGRMVEGRVVPRRRVMALLADLGEARLYVVGLGGALEVL